ncbi:hypothetical protein TWF730_011074 [Orbilia blumenaviensis]|uniref:Carboxylesterase type B domain-containing protein n=1 Tax=Orbilia blumenaviensis TaxID=1796055 RepID=A0AAV9ULK3_9PEZI
MRLVKYLEVSFLASLAFFGTAFCDLPTLNLEWKDYHSEAVDNVKDVMIYRNVRFGRPPTGTFRFKAAEFPDKDFDASKDIPADCPPIPAELLKSPECKAGSSLGFSLELISDPVAQSEDCLFLDIYVPANLTSYKTPLPVVVWFYGGAYILGSKHTGKAQGMLYRGVGAIRSAALHGNGMIFIAGNYRLGALGWLAGSYMEKYGTPNAGLTDQRLLLEFVQKYIQQLNGDPTNVSVWGESAGGGSILHHLVARNADGTIRDPLFKKAIVQSPAYEWRWDREGKLKNEYLRFAKLVGYPDGDFESLQNAPLEKIMNASIEMACSDHRNGLFPFGPSLDGKVITEIPAYALGKPGHYWDKLESVIASHVAKEASLFTKGLKIKNKEDLSKLASLTFPDQIWKVIGESTIYFQPRPWPLSNRCIGGCHTCYTDIVQDSMFMANIRGIYEAYEGRCYMLNYHWPLSDAAVHGTDLLLTFIYEEIDLEELAKDLDPDKWPIIRDYLAKTYQPLVKATASIFQQYFASHAVGKSPSQYKNTEATDWPFPVDGDVLQKGVMAVKFSRKAPGSFTTKGGSDYETRLETYKFWLEILEMIHNPRTRASAQSEATDAQEVVGEKEEL